MRMSMLGLALASLTLALNMSRAQSADEQSGVCGAH